MERSGRWTGFTVEFVEGIAGAQRGGPVTNDEPGQAGHYVATPNGGPGILSSAGRT